MLQSTSGILLTHEQLERVFARAPVYLLVGIAALCFGGLWGAGFLSGVSLLVLAALPGCWEARRAEPGLWPLAVLFVTIFAIIALGLAFILVCAAIEEGILVINRTSLDMFVSILFFGLAARVVVSIVFQKRCYTERSG